MKNGDIDMFFSNMYSTIVLKVPEFSPSLSCVSATLLSKKLVDQLAAQHKQLKLLSEEKVATQVQEDTKLTEKEIHGLCYIGGYICQKLHKKLRNCKRYKENSTQMAISFLNATRECQTPGSDEGDETLFSKFNRGGLWKISNPAKTVFEKTEKHFKIVTSQKNIENY